MSVLHSNVGLVGLSRALTTCMVTQDLGLASCHMSVKDIPDYCTQQAVTEVRSVMVQYIFVIKLLQGITNQWLTEPPSSPTKNGPLITI